MLCVVRLSLILCVKQAGSVIRFTFPQKSSIDVFVRDAIALTGFGRGGYIR